MAHQPLIQVEHRDLPPPFSSVYLSEYRVAAGGGPEALPKYLLAAVLRGNLRYHLPADEELILEAGQVGVIAPHLSHRWQVSAREPTVVLSFSCQPPLAGITGDLDTVFAPQAALPHWRVALEPELIRQTYDWLVGECRHRREVHRPAICGMLLHFLALVARQSIRVCPEFTAARKPEAVSRGIAYIETHLDRQLTLAEIARAAGLGVSRCSEVFKRHTGLSPIRYFNLKRIEKARLLLAQTDLAVYEISARLGFESPYYFSNAFKKSVGCYPREWRKAAGRS